MKTNKKHANGSNRSNGNGSTNGNGADIPLPQVVTTSDSDTSSNDKIKISEIFYSLQGEGTTSGVPTTFIRLVGCPLRCSWCDTEYAFKGGKWETVPDILKKVDSYLIPFVTVTGGEPLAQPNCLKLLTSLCDRHFNTSIETSGALPIENIDPRVTRVMDLKTPSSGECEKNRYKNIDYLFLTDQVKFVISNREDYDWAIEAIKKYDLNTKCQVLFSPMINGEVCLEENLSLARDLAGWFLESLKLGRFQIQLHKLLWGDERRR